MKALGIVGSPRKGGNSEILTAHCLQAITEEGLEPIAIGDSEIKVRRVVAEVESQKQIVLRWYMWDNLERYPEDGLFSVRVHVYVTDSESKSLEAGKTFVRQLFPKVLSWRRF